MKIDLNEVTGLFYGPADPDGVREVYMQVNTVVTLLRTEPESSSGHEKENGAGPGEAQIYRAFAWTMIDDLPAGCTPICEGPIVREIPPEEAERYFNSGGNI